MSWVSLAVALLKIVSTIIIWARQRELISEGSDKAIAAETQAILRQTQAGKLIMEKIDAMSNDDVDSGLRGLEPK
jgi:hypothetical protein